VRSSSPWRTCLTWSRGRASKSPAQSISRSRCDMVQGYHVCQPVPPADCAVAALQTLSVGAPQYCVTLLRANILPRVG